MKRRRGVKMAFLLVGLCAGLAGLANGYERFAPMLKGLSARLPLPIVESPGQVGGDQAFDPVVMMAGLPAGTAFQPAKKPAKPSPEMVIFGPGGNGPVVDLDRMRANRVASAEKYERPPVKESTVVLVRDSEEVNRR